jgi:3-methyladenine DNA glycosylase Mpg
MAEQHYDGPAIQINPASAYAAEMRKWESTYTMYGAPGRPYVYAEYPREMFLAGHPDGRPGKIVILESRAVNSDHERTTLERDGWEASQKDAIQRQKDRDREMARLAAAANFEDRRMSEAAKVERAEVEDATAAHVAEVPRANPKTGKRTIE